MRNLYSLARLPVFRSVIQILKVLQLYRQTLRPIQIDWFGTKDL
jgi:hypothetical protein